jgi:hypothetical protein
MDILFYVIIAVVGVLALVLIFKFLAGCLIKGLLGLAVVAAIVLLVFFLLRC